MLFATNVFIALFTLAVSFLVRADVKPTVPGPEAIYNAGSICLVLWTGDTDPTTFGPLVVPVIIVFFFCFSFFPGLFST